MTLTHVIDGQNQTVVRSRPPRHPAVVQNRLGDLFYRLARVACEQHIWFLRRGGAVLRCIVICMSEILLPTIECL